MKGIRELFMESNSNKQSTHRYGFFYDMFLNYLYTQKGKPLNLLEVGVSQYENGSLPVWAQSELINRAVGVDIQDLPEGSIEKGRLSINLTAIAERRLTT